MTIRAWVITTRLRLGMTQQELGEKIDYSPQLISDVERGKRPATPEFMAKFATFAAREDIGQPPHLPPDTPLRLMCAECPVGCAYSEIEMLGRKSA